MVNNLFYHLPKLLSFIICLHQLLYFFVNSLKNYQFIVEKYCHIFIKSFPLKSLYTTGPNFILFSGSSTKKTKTAPFLYRAPPRYSITSGLPPKCFPVQTAGPESASAVTTALPLTVLTINSFLY